TIGSATSPEPCRATSPLRNPQRSLLFPYATLFRSPSTASSTAGRASSAAIAPSTWRPPWFETTRPLTPAATAARASNHGGRQVRSEEHTSELQSREKLVCRLLLEKKKAARS